MTSRIFCEHPSPPPSLPSTWHHLWTVPKMVHRLSVSKRLSSLLIFRGFGKSYAFAFNWFLSNSRSWRTASCRCVSPDLTTRSHFFASISRSWSARWHRVPRLDPSLLTRRRPSHRFHLCRHSSQVRHYDYTNLKSRLIRNRFFEVDNVKTKQNDIYLIPDAWVYIIIL